MKAFQFSLENRNQSLPTLESQAFDLIIIGGGITGAGIALDAATRGLKVVLFEKQDFAAGTSSRSTKLIHGGLRYLKQLEFGLVREVGKERETLHQNAPHLVVSQKMLLPIIKNGSLGEISTSLGLWVYDRVAGVKEPERRKMLNKAETLKEEPLLNKEKLQGGGLYYEYQTDDARLTMEVLKAAAQKGAQCFNYTEVAGFLYEEGQITGVEVKDGITNHIYNVKAQKVVSATGPWVDEVRNLDENTAAKQLFITKGVHLVIPHSKLPIKQAVYFDVGDDRMIFAIPRGKVTYVGTTDTVYKADLERPAVGAADAQYLLKAVNKMFPSGKLSTDDVVSTWAGLRPLIYEEGKSPSELSRKDEIFFSDSGLISIAGGKLTGYRKMAERTVDEVVDRLGKKTKSKIKDCVTDEIRLGNTALFLPTDVEAYIAKLSENYGLNTIDIASLVYKYGEDATFILETYSGIESDQSDQIKLLRAELAYTIENEMVTSLCDFLIRRSGRLYFELPETELIVEELLELMQEQLGWDDATKAQNRKEWRKEADAVKIRF